MVNTEAIEIVILSTKMHYLECYIEYMSKQNRTNKTGKNKVETLSSNRIIYRMNLLQSEIKKDGKRYDKVIILHNDDLSLYDLAYYIKVLRTNLIHSKFEEEEQIKMLCVEKLRTPPSKKINIFEEEGKR